MNNYYLYYHLNPQTKEVFYVGIGVNGRAWDFVSGRSAHYKNYLKKYGNPIVDIVLQNLTKFDACNLEKEYIAKYGRKGIDPEGVLVNKSIGGEITALGNKFSEEQKKKISQSKTGQKYRVVEGRIHGSKGKPKPKDFMNDEMRKKIGDGNRGKKHKPHKNKGVPIAEETKRKIGEANSRPKPPGFGDIIRNLIDYKLVGEKNSKPIIQLDKNNNIIQEFKSIKEALEYFKKSINNSCITSCLKGRQKTAFGFIWKYKE